MVQDLVFLNYQYLHELFYSDTEDNVGIVAGIIFEILGEKDLTILRKKVAKNENFCDFVRDLVFELSDENEKEN